jgi:DNA-binding response OmpR family regulator
LLQTLLNLDGFDVVLAARGADVLPKAAEEAPDVFLIDYHLNDAHGTEIVAALRADARFAATPIVMTSGLNVEDEALKHGANRFLVKPFDPGALSSIFHALIGTP